MAQAPHAISDTCADMLQYIVSGQQPQGRTRLCGGADDRLQYGYAIQLGSINFEKGLVACRIRLAVCGSGPGLPFNAGGSPRVLHDSSITRHNHRHGLLICRRGITDPCNVGRHEIAAVAPDSRDRADRSMAGRFRHTTRSREEAALGARKTRLLLARHERALHGVSRRRRHSES